jgi:RNA polymerase sigma-70 factor (ECF subfamily)
LPQTVTDSALPYPVEGLESIFRAHHGMVLKAAYRLTGSLNDAEDVAQTVFLRLVQKHFDAVEVANLEGYLYRAAVNAALDVVRARREERNQPLDEGMLPGGGPFIAADRMQASAEVREWLRRALAGMPPKPAEIFVLRYIEELDVRDIAQMLQLSRAAVVVSLHRSRRHLQKEFQKQYRGKP